MTYGELWHRSDALATRLVGETTPVAVRGHKEPEMLVAFLAAVKAGQPYIPLDASIPEERVRRILATSGAGVVLTATALPEGEQGGEVPRSKPLGPDDVFYIMYTSGSTGEPKGVQITRSSVDGFVDWMLEEQHFMEQGEVFLNQVPFSFDVSVMDLYLSLVTGGTLWSLSRQVMSSPNALFRSLAESGVTTWVSTPSFAVMCLTEQRFNAQMLPNLRRFLFCGETLTPDCVRRLHGRFPGAEVCNTYGPTEATVATTSVKVTPELLAQYSPLPVGYAKPGTQLLVLSDAGDVQPEGERGEIVIVGPNVSVGYLNNPEATARSFSVRGGMRAYRTGDWGHYRDGLLFFEGRMDFQVKLSGYRIELGDVEANLRALDCVEDAVVLPAMKDGQPAWLVGFVRMARRPERSDSTVVQALRKELSARLPAYMIPRQFFIMESFPMTANGKVDRKQLAEKLR